LITDLEFDTASVSHIHLCLGSSRIGILLPARPIPGCLTGCHRFLNRLYFCIKQLLVDFVKKSAVDGADTVKLCDLFSQLREQGIPLFHIAYTVEGAGLRPHDATFIVSTKDNRTESLMFTREEIADSAHRIDSFADAKIRVLVSRCSGRREWKLRHHFRVCLSLLMAVEIRLFLAIDAFR
jgi:hypothetical protein